MKGFQLESGLRYRVEDSILGEPSPAHQEHKFYAVCCPQDSSAGSVCILYEARSRFGYEVVSPEAAVLWELSGEAGELHWECRPNHILCAEQCSPCSAFVPPDALREIEQDARREGGGGTPAARVVGVELRDGCDYFDSDHQHWRVHRLKNGFLQRPVWVLYEPDCPERVFEVRSDGSFRAWSNDLGRFLSDRQTPYKIADEHRRSGHTLRDMGLKPLELSPGLRELREAITNRKTGRK